MEKPLPQISEKNKKILLSYQINNTENIIRNVINNKSVLDASDTGTGKTYSAVCACATLKLRPIVVCPKAVMANWKRVCKIFDVKPFFIVNYETLKSSKYYNANGNRVKCPYIEFYQKDKARKIDEHYKWIDLPDDVIFIYDEVHKCSNIRTFNGLLLLASKEYNKCGVIILSATIADNAEKFKIFFYILNFIEKSQAEQLKLTFKSYINVVDNWISRAPKPMLRIHSMLFPDRATRMSIDVLGDLFPQTQITATPYSMGKHVEEKIQEQYEILNESLTELKDKTKKDKGNILTRVLRAHQKIELLKIPTFVEITQEFLEQGFSVVIFVNFTKTLENLADLLKTDCIIYGEQSDTDRQYNIDSFQADTKFVIICNIKAGGVGISLHDVNGKRKRVSLISPCWSPIDLTQALGRIHRAGGKSKSLQRIIYCANSVEEKIADKLQRRLKDLSNINNGDLDLSNITFENKPVDIN